tara:strand:- start:3102 stop:3641 length:540 start_codon:yes stop_codon:yes gene_type:complete
MDTSDKALAARLRFTAPLDDEGRDIAVWLNATAARWRANGNPGYAVEFEEAAAYIERQADYIAALTAVPEEVEGLCEQASLYIEPIRAGSYSVDSSEEIEGLYLTAEWIEKAAAALRAYAANPAKPAPDIAKLRRDVEAMGNSWAPDIDDASDWEAGIRFGSRQTLKSVLALIDQQEGE